MTETFKVDGRVFGPNAKRLLFRFMAREAIPPGGGVYDGAKFLLDAEHRKQVTERAMTNFDTAMAAVRAAPDNPHGDDEEAISAAILEQLTQSGCEELYTTSWMATRDFSDASLLNNIRLVTAVQEEAP